MHIRFHAWYIVGGLSSKPSRPRAVGPYPIVFSWPHAVAHGSVADAFRKKRVTPPGEEVWRAATPDTESNNVIFGKKAAAATACHTRHHFGKPHVGTQAAWETRLAKTVAVAAAATDCQKRQTTNSESIRRHLAPNH